MSVGELDVSCANRCAGSCRWSGVKKRRHDGDNLLGQMRVD
jgi:hypothetical protein